MIYAPKFPLRKKDNSTFENVSDIKELIKFHLTNLLLTNPGEKISDPEYGVGLRRYLFENFSSNIAPDIEFAIEQAMSRYLSYLGLNGVSIEEDQDQNILNIRIHYTILETTENEILEIGLNIGDTGTSGPVY